jgi:hypothetical protein
MARARFRFNDTSFMGVIYLLRHLSCVSKVPRGPDPSRQACAARSPHVDTFEEEVEIDIDAVQKEIDGIETELAKTRKQMAAY